MKLLVGLGNPGKKFEQTRHNVGFLFVEQLAKEHRAVFKSKTSFEGELAEVTINEDRWILLKPQTFMNVSGRSVKSVVSKNPMTSEDILVVYDDADLPFGDVRFRRGGSAGGHNGMKSIMESFPPGTSIARLRIGIGRPIHTDIPLEDFVLQPFTKSEQQKLAEIFELAKKKIDEYVAK